MEGLVRGRMSDFSFPRSSSSNTMSSEVGHQATFISLS